MTKADSTRNIELYQKISAELHWTVSEEEDFLRFAQEIPVRGGLKSDQQMPAYKFPSLKDLGSETALRLTYNYDGEPVGLVFLRPKNITLFFGSSGPVSAMIPFNTINNKKDAALNLFPTFDESKVRYLSLEAEGGLSYAQATDNGDSRKKITYVNATHWFHPDIGGARQIWLKTDYGIPGSPAPLKVRNPMGSLQPISG